jgi:hypothetical protein
LEGGSTSAVGRHGGEHITLLSNKQFSHESDFLLLVIPTPHGFNELMPRLHKKDA